MRRPRHKFVLLKLHDDIGLGLVLGRVDVQPSGLDQLDVERSTDRLGRAWARLVWSGCAVLRGASSTGVHGLAHPGWFVETKPTNTAGTAQGVTDSDLGSGWCGTWSSHGGEPDSRGCTDTSIAVSGGARQSQSRRRLGQSSGSGGDSLCVRRVEGVVLSRRAWSRLVSRTSKVLERV